MNDIVKLGFALTGIALMAGGVLYHRSESIERETALVQNPLAEAHEIYQDMEGYLENAQELLLHNPEGWVDLLISKGYIPEDVPDPGLAKLALEGALMLYDVTPPDAEGDAMDIRTRVTEIQESLPDHVGLIWLQGSSADNSLFEEQRLAIGEVRDDVQELSREYLHAAYVSQGIDPDSNPWNGMYAMAGGCVLLIVGLSGGPKRDESPPEILPPPLV